MNLEYTLRLKRYQNWRIWDEQFVNLMERFRTRVCAFFDCALSGIGGSLAQAPLGKIANNSSAGHSLRSETCPSPNSMTRQTPSWRSPRSML